MVNIHDAGEFKGWATRPLSYLEKLLNRSQALQQEPKARFLLAKRATAAFKDGLEPNDCCTMMAQDPRQLFA